MSNTRTTRSTVVRTAGRFLVGATAALTLTAGAAGVAGAHTPAPQFDPPIAAAPHQPKPKPNVPLGAIDLGVAQGDGPGPVDGPGDFTNPEGGGEPGPFDGPGDFTNPEGGDEPGPFDGPGDFTNPDGGGGGGGGFGGPDDFVEGGGGPSDPETPETPEVPGTDDGIDVSDGSDSAGGELGEVELPAELALTGNETELLAAGLALLTAGGLVSIGGVAMRRRSSGTSGF